MSTIGDPFLLSAYSHPRRKRNDTQKSTLSSNVFASHNIASSSKSDGFVTVAAAADGVQVLDVRAQNHSLLNSLKSMTYFL